MRSLVVKVLILCVATFFLSFKVLADAGCIVGGISYPYSHPKCSGPATSAVTTTNTDNRNKAANPACQVTQEKAQTDLAAELAKKYPDSYATQKMLLDSGMEAFNKLCQVPSDPISDGVLRKLVGRYYPSYGTVLMLYENEMKAYKSLQK